VVEALAELRRCSGTQFHPRVVEAFAEVFNEMFG
jgi:HD-GYP domain-containing protein (c-di-GMP phosphodiesterase class II)